MAHGAAPTLHPTDIDVRVDALEVAQAEVASGLRSVDRTLGQVTHGVREQTEVMQQMLGVMQQILTSISTRREGPWARVRRHLAEWAQTSMERWYLVAARVRGHRHG